MCMFLILSVCGIFLNVLKYTQYRLNSRSMEIELNNLLHIQLIELPA